MFVPLAHNYSNSIIKRVVRINKRPSHNYATLKNIIILPIVTTLMLMCSLKNDALIPGYYSGTLDGEKIITIGVNRNSEVPKTDLSQHKDRDFEIYRVKWDTIGDSYFFTTYQFKNSQLEEHSDFAYQTKDDFDMASYKWVNDSSLMFNLINSSKKIQVSYRLNYYNNGNASLGRVQDSTK